MRSDYELLDAGCGEKLERFGEYILRRPCPQARQDKILSREIWEKADVTYLRKEGKAGGWYKKNWMPEEWVVELSELKFKLNLGLTGQIGLFPEHQQIWSIATEWISAQVSPVKVLNLFAYTGGATLIAALAGAQVCHVDAMRGAINQAKENATINNLQDKPIRWIQDDAGTFVRREIKRKQQYDLIILDPPSYGRMKGQDHWDIKRDLDLLLQQTAQLLTPRGMLILSGHSTENDATALAGYLAKYFPNGNVKYSELTLNNSDLAISMGSYACVDYSA